MIHEATLQDDEKEMAHMKGHSTVGQAIEIATKAGAKNLILTHFSQRYPKLARRQITENDSSENSKVPTIVSAFDLVPLPVEELWKMERYQAGMEKLFEADSIIASGEGEEDSVSGEEPISQEGGKAKGKKEAQKDAKAEQSNPKQEQQSTTRSAKRKDEKKGKSTAQENPSLADLGGK